LARASGIGFPLGQRATGFCWIGRIGRSGAIDGVVSARPAPGTILTLDDALELLGVEGESDLATLRRAYLRAVRAHPPQRDPEGFQLVREAWELLQRRACARPDLEASASAREALTEAPSVAAIVRDEESARGGRPSREDVERASGEGISRMPTN